MVASTSSPLPADGDSIEEGGNNFVVSCSKENISTHSALSNDIEVNLKREHSFAEDSFEEMLYVDDNQDDEKTVEFRNTSKDCIMDTKSNRTVQNELDESVNRLSYRDRLFSQYNSVNIVMPIPPSSLELAASVDNVDDDDYSTQRKSHLCCLACCDLVRACVIINCIDVVLACFVVILCLFGHEELFLNTVNLSFNGFEMGGNMDPILFSKYQTNKLMIISSLGTLFAALGSMGALKFRPYPVLATAIWYIVYGIFGVFDARCMGAIIIGFFCYPHFALYSALKRSQITPQNYKIEQHCCCGRRKVRS